MKTTHLFLLSLTIIITITGLSSLTGMVHVKQQINIDEQNYIQQRVNTIQKNFPNTPIPRIGLCFSGGGHRAMCSTLGFLMGAKKIGLLDAAQYISTLSGSTWALASLLARHIQSDSSALTNFKNLLQNNINQPFLDWNLICSMYLRSHSVIDMWGKLIAHHLFKDLIKSDRKKFKSIRFSQLSTTPDQYPYVIFTAIQDITNNNYDYVDVTPKTFWSPYFNTGVTTASLEDIAQLKLSSFLGIFGSAYSLSPQDATNLLIEELFDLVRKKQPTEINTKDGFFLSELIKTILYKRLAPPIIPNIGYGLNNPLSNQKEIEIVDAGISFNLPIPALTRRNIDILIICDASEGAENNQYEELQKAVQKYILPTQTPFPSINTPTSVIEKQNTVCSSKSTMMVFKSSDPKIPVIIYFPGKIDISTFHFQYTPEESNQVISFMEQTVTLCTQDIWNVILTRAHEQVPINQ